MASWYGPATFKLAVKMYEKFVAEGALIPIGGTKRRVWRGHFSKMARDLGISNQYLHQVLRLMRAHGCIIITAQGNRWVTNEVILVPPKPTEDDFKMTAGDVMGQTDGRAENIDARIKLAEVELASLRKIRGRGRPKNPVEPPVMKSKKKARAEKEARAAARAARQ